MGLTPKIAFELTSGLSVVEQQVAASDASPTSDSAKPFGISSVSGLCSLLRCG